MCGAEVERESEKVEHERVCGMLRRGEEKARKAMAASKVKGSRSVDPHLESLLRSTADFALKFKGAPQRWRPDGDFLEPRHGFPAGFSRNFGTNKYVHSSQYRTSSSSQCDSAFKSGKVDPPTRRVTKPTQINPECSPFFNLEEQDNLWSRFVHRSLGKAPLRYRDVPFVPASDLEKLDKALDRAAVRSLILRWHPDKFGSSFGRRFVDDVERSKVMEKVKETR